MKVVNTIGNFKARDRGSQIMLILVAVYAASFLVMQLLGYNHVLEGVLYVSAGLLFTKGVFLKDRNAKISALVGLICVAAIFLLVTHDPSELPGILTKIMRR